MDRFRGSLVLFIYLLLDVKLVVKNNAPSSLIKFQSPVSFSVKQLISLNVFEAQLNTVN